MYLTPTSIFKRLCVLQPMSTFQMSMLSPKRLPQTIQHIRKNLLKLQENVSFMESHTSVAGSHIKMVIYSTLPKGMSNETSEPKLCACRKPHGVQAVSALQRLLFISIDETIQSLKA